MNQEFICTECTGMSGEEHRFNVSVDDRPIFCPFCGNDRPVKPVEKYLRSKIEELEGEIERLEEE